MENDQRLTAPYVPFSTFMTAIEVLHQGLPNVLDKSVFRSLSGTAQNQTMSAFRYFGFIDDNREVQPSLRNFVHDRENRKELIRELLEQAYPEVIALARTNGTVPQLNVAMERYGVKGTTVPKAIAFFLKAAEYAELPVSPLWKNLVRKRNGSIRGRRQSPARNNVSKPTDLDDIPAPQSARTEPATATGESRTFTLAGGDQLTIVFSRPFIQLPAQDRRWLSQLIDLAEEYEIGRVSTEAPSYTPNGIGSAQGHGDSFMQDGGTSPN